MHHCRRSCAHGPPPPPAPEELEEGEEPPPPPPPPPPQVIKRSKIQECFPEVDEENEPSTFAGDAVYMIANMPAMQLTETEASDPAFDSAYKYDEFVEAMFGR